MIWALTIAIILHILIWLNFPLTFAPPEHPSEKIIEVSMITTVLPIKTKQNDQTEAKPQAVSLPAPPKLIKPVDKIVEKSVLKPISKTVDLKKEPLKPKVVTIEKSEVVVKKEIKPEKIANVEPSKKIEELSKEKPRLSLESLQQQISQVGSDIRQQQVSERDKYISAFSSKVKRIGQEIYDRGTLPAGSLTTLVEINADGTIKNLKITRSSGNKKLDDAVENMVYSASPYSVLPFQLQNESATLTFSRTWEFFGD